MTVPPLPEPPPVTRCSQCGADNKAGHTFCDRCGTALATDSSYKQIISLAVPRSTPWQPQVAQQLAITLFALPAPLSLGIQARPNRIEWYIETRRQQSEAVVKAIFALYPQAQITVQPKRQNHVGYYLFDLHTATPFVAPLKMADEFPRLDPLVSFINTLTDLEPEEAVSYELYLAETSPDYFKIGEELITASTVHWWNFLHPGVAVVAATEKLLGADKVDKYVPEIQKPARAKLNSPLKAVYFDLKLKVDSQERAQELIRQLIPALSVFEQPGLNYLIGAYDHSFAPVLTPGEVAALWHLPSEQCQSSGVVWAKSAVAPLPGPLIGQTEGIVLGHNLYQGRRQAVRLTYADRVTHVNLVGRTRVGKSTLLHRMVHQDIANGHGVAVIDPHGDLVEAILASSIPPDREREVVLFDVRDHDYPLGLNLLTHLPGVSEETTAGLALAVVRKMFADGWSGGRMETVLDAALRALVSVEGTTLQDIPKLLLNPKYRREILQQVRDPATLDFWYDEYNQESPGQQREFARPISYRIRKFYRDPTLRRIVCQKQSLNFRQVLDEKKIFLANLGGLPEVEAETLGALLIAKIQLAAMSRIALTPAQRTPYYFYIDEVQNFIVTSLAKMFSEAGKYGLSLTVANQFLQQLQGETLESLMGNVGTTLMFRLGPQDARALAPFVKPHFAVESLTDLDRFAAVVKLQLDGETLPAFSLETQPPLEKPADAEERVARLRQHSRQTYGRPAADIDAELMARYQDQADELPPEEGDYFD